MTRLELCVYFYHSADLSKQRNQSIRKQNRPFCRCSFQKQVFEYDCLACSSSFKHWNITQAEHVLILNWTCLAQASERACDLKQLLGECSEIFSEIGNYKFDSIPHHCVLPRRMISECFNYSATEREFFSPLMWIPSEQETCSKKQETDLSSNYWVRFPLESVVGLSKK